MLSFTTYILIIALLGLVCNILTWMPQGIMREQLLCLGNTKNERSFDGGEGRFSISRMLMLVQWFVFAGILIYLYAENDAAARLASPDLDTVVRLTGYMMMPVAWFVAQWMLFRWWGYIFNLGRRIVILERIYKAVYVLAGPLAFLAFVMQVTGWIDPWHGIILLSLIFICAQIVFIFSGFKIFYDGILSLFIIILYLCALKIAPLLVIWHQMIN
ncbi:MAG: DUF4271 domain-containing protein [Bacteroidales bacterium]|nr:DUF4271 domain-containing protein [Candidatus Liminaster caballi]